MKQIIKNNSTGIQGNNINLHFNNFNFDSVENFFKFTPALVKIQNGEIAVNFESGNQFIDNLIPSPTFDIPSLPEKKSNRTELIANLLDHLRNYNWLSIEGEKASGKSCLALLLEKHFEGKNKWISFRDIKKEWVNEYFNKFCFLLFKEQIPSNGTDYFFSNCLSKYPKRSIFIFDDLPDLKQNCILMQKLISFFKACKENEIKIISTSYFNLPESLKNTVGINNLKIFNTTPFNLEEIEELLQIYNSQIVDKRIINLILVVTKGNPVLIQAVAAYLDSKKWKLDINLLEKILKKDFAESESKEFLSIFSNTVDEDTKELTYRLDLILDDFTDREVKLVSEVPPKIKNSFEKFNSISNIWIRKVGDKFSISPLIKDTGKKNLLEDTIVEVNSTLAKDKLSKRELNQYDTIHVIPYLLAAKRKRLINRIF